MKKNYCKIGHLISECSAKDPTKCRFFEKAQYHNRCMYQSIQLGDCYNCGCREAQEARRKEKKKIDEELYLEINESNLDI